MTKVAQLFNDLHEKLLKIDPANYENERFAFVHGSGIGVNSAGEPGINVQQGFYGGAETMAIFIYSTLKTALKQGEPVVELLAGIHEGLKLYNNDLING